MRATATWLLITISMLSTGCERRLTGTRLDLSPIPLPLPIVAPDSQARAQLNEIFGKFLEACDRDAGEFAPDHPLEVDHLYVHDATENVQGMWGFNIFDTYDEWINIYKTHADVSLVKDLTKIDAGPKKFLLRRAVLEQTTIGQYTYRGGRQEFIDTSSGKVIASRTNYYLGSDFARGVSCLDSNWSEGFRSFVTRTIGFSPGFPRSDSWVGRIPSRYVRADLRSRTSSSKLDYMAPIRPEGSVYDYNKRSIFINGVAHYLRQTFNNEPLAMVGVQLFPRRTLITYETNPGAPNALFQIRDGGSGQLLQEIFVKLPLALHRRADKSIRPHSWRLSKEGVRFENGRIVFDVIQNESERDSEDQRYFSYRLDAPWNTEDIERKDLPPHLSDSSYGMFSLPEKNVGSSVAPKQIIGKWSSVPVRALWEFKDDNTLALPDKTVLAWKIENGVLTAHERFWTANESKASFRISKDGKQLEVTKRNVAGTYEPFVLHRGW